MTTQIQGCTKWTKICYQDTLYFLPIARSGKNTYKCNLHLYLYKKGYTSKIHRVHIVKITHKSWLKIQTHIPKFLRLSDTTVLVARVYLQLLERLKESLCHWKIQFSSKPGTTENHTGQSEPRTFFQLGLQNRGVQWSIKMQTTSGINYSNIVHENQGMCIDGIMGHCAKQGQPAIRSGMRNKKSYRHNQKKKRKKKREIFHRK